MKKRHKIFVLLQIINLKTFVNKLLTQVTQPKYHHPKLKIF